MKKYLIVVALALTLTACSDEVETPIDTNEVVEEIVAVEVEFLTPTKLEVNVPVKLEVQVTQGQEIVNDADDVKLEVWQSGMREHGEMIDGQFLGDGIFSAETTFTEEGVYYMFAHTNARGMHVMPKQEMTVGNPDMSTVLPDDSSNTMNNSEHSSH